VHFCVLVAVGPNDSLDGLLEPYDENIEVEPYWQLDHDLDDPTLDHSRIHEWIAKADAAGEPFNEWAQRVWDQPHKLANAADEPHDPNGRKVWSQCTYNPQGEWDYWTIGGRYSDRLMTDLDGICDEAKISDLAINKMKARRLVEATKRWVAFHDRVAGIPPVPSWPEYKESFTPEQIASLGTIDERKGEEVVRQFYWSEPYMVAAKGTGWWGNPVQEFFADRPREEGFALYLEQAELSALSAYAYVDKSGWHDQPSVPFGAPNSHERDHEWAVQVNDWVASLDTRTTLVVVDCHS
jgi:hypothetical protein